MSTKSFVHATGISPPRRKVTVLRVFISSVVISSGRGVKPDFADRNFMEMRFVLCKSIQSYVHVYTCIHVDSYMWVSPLSTMWQSCVSAR